MRVSVASIQLEKNYSIAVRDAHAIWHRAIILGLSLMIKSVLNRFHR